MNYSYKYPHPAVTTDVVLFSTQNSQLKLLLIKRGQEPYKNQWALPGGFLDIDEDLEICAKRELAEETGITDIYLEQLYTFGKPGRDPRERVISVAYLAILGHGSIAASAGDDAAEVEWFSVQHLPSLAFDHADVINMALQRLAAKLNYSTLALQFLPERFSLAEIQKIYEIILGHTLDKRNFRKWILSKKCLVECEGGRKNGHHRAARLYALKQPGSIEFLK